MILKAELETLKKKYHQLIDIHSKLKIQMDKVSVGTQTEVRIYVCVFTIYEYIQSNVI